jgi:UDP-N-acetylglucosamine--N-acetylmuramyl-(pentapeptide) pyrophosphoryl-undecaprenol N-acetylglucosamine transferase
MRLLFTGGGTAGHVSPAIAIAEYVKKNSRADEIAFVGRLGGDENRAILKRGYKLYEIDISGFLRRLSFENLKRIIKLSHALREAKKIIKEFHPDAVIATGGYVSWPVIKMAQKRKIPTYIHESNAYPGLVTRLVAKKCDKVFLNTDAAQKYLRRQDNVLVVGNPVESRFYETERQKARTVLRIKRDEFLIVSYAGSGGAEKINETISEFIKGYSAKNPKIKHIHATGKKYYDEFIESYKDGESSENGITVLPYIDDLHIALAASDIVISRSGAMTLTELSASKSAAILIPSPNVAGNHQYKNAKALEDKGAAKIIEEKDLTKEILANEIEKMINNPKEREKLSKNVSKEFKRDAETEILKEVFQSAKK